MPERKENENEKLPIQQKLNDKNVVK